MSKRKLLWILFVGLLVVGVSVSAVAAQGPRPGGRAPRGALGTEFTYQGRLTDGGSPANGAYDLEFKLYDAESGVTQIGSTAPKNDVIVTGGLFTTQLDFGASAFNGEARWLEIGVRPGASTGAYTTLVPRQPLTAVPYALYSMTAGAVNYKNVVIVAKSGGNYATITAALNIISDASDTNRYLVRVMPGVYSEQVTMRQYVDIEGAGELTTKITYTGGGAAENTGTVVGANNAELRFLTVENTGGTASAIGIYNSGASPRLTHVTATAAGGTTNFGIINTASSSPPMTNVTAKATGGTDSIGICNRSSSPPMTNVTATGSGGTRSYGVSNGLSSPTMNNVTATGSEGGFNSGVHNLNSSPTMMYVNATASGGTGSWNRGVYNQSSSPTIQNSILRASGGTTNTGIYNYAASGSYIVKISNSQVSADSNTILNDSAYYTTRVGASLLDGGAVSVVGGTVTCAGVYDETYAFYASTCP